MVDTCVQDLSEKLNALFLFSLWNADVRVKGLKKNDLKHFVFVLKIIIHVC